MQRVHLVKVFTLPVEHGFVNGFTEWAKYSEHVDFGITREPANADRYDLDTANIRAAAYQAKFGDKVHCSVVHEDSLH